MHQAPLQNEWAVMHLNTCKFGPAAFFFALEWNTHIALWCAEVHCNTGVLGWHSSLHKVKGYLDQRMQFIAAYHSLEMVSAFAQANIIFRRYRKYLTEMHGLSSSGPFSRSVAHQCKKSFAYTLWQGMPLWSLLGHLYEGCHREEMPLLLERAPFFSLSPPSPELNSLTNLEIQHCPSKSVAPSRL